MVCGGKTARYRIPLIVGDGDFTAVRYRDEILAVIVVPFLQRHSLGIMFQQDNARTHTAHVVQNIVQQ